MQLFAESFFGAEPISFVWTSRRLCRLKSHFLVEAEERLDLADEGAMALGDALFPAF